MCALVYAQLALAPVYVGMKGPSTGKLFSVCWMPLGKEIREIVSVGVLPSKEPRVEFLLLLRFFLTSEIPGIPLKLHFVLLFSYNSKQFDQVKNITAPKKEFNAGLSFC